MTANRQTIQKLAAAGGLGITFMVLASVFSPDRTRASGPASPVAPPSGMASTSSNPHEGLRQLGSLDGVRYRIDVYATDAGPRYSIYERASGIELGVLMSPAQVDRYYPEIGLPALEFGEWGSALMLAEPQFAVE